VLEGWLAVHKNFVTKRETERRQWTVIKLKMGSGKAISNNKNEATRPNDQTTRMWANAQRDGRPAEYR